MKRTLLLALAVLFAWAGSAAKPEPWQNELRAPAYPLVTLDPYFSLWSVTDCINADVTRHWTGRKQPMLAALRVDGVSYRVLGSEVPDPAALDGMKNGKRNRVPDEWYSVQGPVVFGEAAVQKNVNVLPTSTVYTLECGPVELEMTFLSPLTMDNADLFARPVSYLTFRVHSLDKAKHTVQLYFEASPRLAMDLDMVPMEASTGKADGVNYVRVGTVEQKVLGKRGDDLRIDWGYFYLASAKGSGRLGIVESEKARREFVAGGSVSGFEKKRTSDNFVKDDMALALCIDLGKVRGAKEETLLLAYDDIRSVRYLGKNLRPYWNRLDDNTITKEMARAGKEFSKAREACEAWDAKLLGDAVKAGGKKYADLCALAYRQVIAAHKLVMGPKGRPFLISKENYSNGCAGTVDVAYPAMPLFLCYNIDLAKALIEPIFDYAESAHWTRSWAPHDIGQYPDCYGQHYGNWMPLEECGNMLLLSLGVAFFDGDVDYLLSHWTCLTKWVLYAVEHGQYPENQLCTDDFAGKLEHNANLAVKSILGIAAYGRMAGALGLRPEEMAFLEKAVEMAKKWRLDSEEADHFKLTYDTPDSWSLKYNLVWDRLFRLNVFPQDIVGKELDYYRKKLDPFGVPLDSRKHYTKTDWSLWIAAMARDKEGFDAFFEPVYRFYNESPDRVPLCDWVNTEEPTIQNMHARSVVGGFWMRVLVDKVDAAIAAAAAAEKKARK